MIVELVEGRVLGVRLIRHLEALGLVLKGVTVVVTDVDGARTEHDGLSRAERTGQGIAVASQADYHVRALAHPVNHQLLVRVVQRVHLEMDEKYYYRGLVIDMVLFSFTVWK